MSDYRIVLKKRLEPVLGGYPDGEALIQSFKNAQRPINRTEKSVNIPMAEEIGNSAPKMGDDIKQGDVQILHIYIIPPYDS